MAKAERTEVMSVDRDALFKVITDYEKYPEFVSGVKKAKLQSRTGSVAKVQYLIDQGLIRPTEHAPVVSGDGNG